MKKTKSKETTETGLKILQIAAEHGFITAKEIEQISKSEKQAFRYINNMNNRNGFLENFNTNLKPLKAFFVTKKGADVLSNVGRFRVVSLFKPCDFGPSEYYHNLAIIQARLAIEKHPQFVDFETPRVLMARIGDLPELKPDAEIIFRENLTPESRTFRAGLEVELRPKWHKRNIRKMLKFDSGKFSHLQSVIWVCNDNATIDALCRAIKDSKIFEPSKHRFLLLSELLAKGPVDCEVKDWRGEGCGLFL